MSGRFVAAMMIIPSFTPKPSIFQPTVEIWSSGSLVPALPAGLTITRGLAPLKLV